MFLLAATVCAIRLRHIDDAVEGDIAHVQPDVEGAGLRATSGDSSCTTVNDKLTKISSKAIMAANGWSFIDLPYSDMKHPQYCVGHDKTWYGWKGGAGVGTLRTTLSGHCSARLAYGNCYNHGIVSVYINNVLKDQAPVKSQREFVFNFEDGDVLELKDEGANSIISLSALEFGVPRKPDSSCTIVNDQLTKITSKAIMAANGWSFIDLPYGDMKHPQYCVGHDKTWYGWKGGVGVGTLRTTLSGHCSARLVYANCLNSGIVSVYINNVLKDQAPVKSEREFVFNFEDGDVLELKDEGANSIISLRALEFGVPRKPDNNCTTVNDQLTKITSQAIMAASGWSFIDLTHADMKYPQYCKEYPTTWFGWKSGKTAGALRATLSGHCRARVVYGNCWASGFVGLYINGVLKDQAYAKSERQFFFDFKDGDVLEFKDADADAIISLRTLEFLPRRGSGHSCTIANEHLSSVVSKEVMAGNGWNFDFTDGDMKDSRYCKNHANTWYGWSKTMEVGTLRTTLSGHCSARLAYGNCWTVGVVKVYINGVLKDLALPKVDREFLFDFEDGDVLEIKDEGPFSIISLRALDFLMPPQPDRNCSKDNAPLTKLTSKETMVAAGWTFDFTHDIMQHKHLCAKHPTTWFGYSSGTKVGTLRTTLSGRCHARLLYGNCYTTGLVTVYINGVLRDQATARVDRKFEFDFNDGDVLEIKDEGPRPVVSIQELEFYNPLSPGERCVQYNTPLSDIRNKNVMVKNGWDFDFDQDTMVHRNIAALCGKYKSWFGWSGGGKSPGILKATFLGSCSARVRYSNCLNSGAINLYVNGNLRNYSSPGVTCEYEFDFDVGDFLEIKDENDYGNPIIWLQNVEFFTRAPKITTTTTTTTTLAVRKCKTVQLQSHRTISSPHYPRRYVRDQVRCWHIQTAEPNRVQLTFTFFKLEYHPTCDFDYVALYDGANDTSPMMAKLCGTNVTLPVYASSSNEVYIRFKTDWSVEKRGFAATLKAQSGSNA